MYPPAGGVISICRPTEVSGAMTLRNPGQSLDDTVRFRAHWTIFLPTIIVALLYGGLWVFLLVVGKGDTALARILLLVLLLVVPVLLVRAYLRFVTFGLVIGRRALTYRQGWLRPGWHRIQLDTLTGVRASMNPLGRMLGGGALILTRLDGGDICLNDVEFPEEAARQISRRLRTMQARHKPI
ncbi:MAG TPA: PH domain-containing protein [Rhizobiales bacterium]|nr:PH domain-containing protein [Hyphomicrobiales bacterium]